MRAVSHGRYKPTSWYRYNSVSHRTIWAAPKIKYPTKFECSTKLDWTETKNKNTIQRECIIKSNFRVVVYKNKANGIYASICFHDRFNVSEAERSRPPSMARPAVDQIVYISRRKNIFPTPPASPSPFPPFPWLWRLRIPGVPRSESINF